MIIRSTVAAFEIYARARRHHDLHPTLGEQDCIRDAIFSGEDGKGELAPEVMMIPQWKSNAFPEEIRCWDRHQRGWEPGLLLIHFAGAWAHVKEPDPTGYLMRKYEHYIIWP
jgi:mannan polymerase II complex MNN10 subunit